MIEKIIPSFGYLPKGKSLERVRKSKQYNGEIFHNASDTPMMTEGASFFKIMKLMFMSRNTVPKDHIPVIKRDLMEAVGNNPVLTWFGHSSYLLQIGGKNILVDPVFSERTSPVQFIGTKQFKGTEVYSANDLPPIDYLIITHDHYDHLDYRTIQKLAHKVGVFYTTLGVGAHLEGWGVPKEIIHEMDWDEHVALSDSIRLTACPARHFAGRGMINRNKSLWSSFVLEADGMKIFIGGDSGYDTHFKKIGEKHGPFDLVILECGQYNKFWRHIHMMPEETVQAAKDLKAKLLLPVHWGKFKLSVHPWKEPIQRLVKEAERVKMAVVTPMIGEKLIIGEEHPQINWWEDIR